MSETTNMEEIDVEEFDERVKNIEEDDPTPEQPRGEIMSFNDLLEIRETLVEIEDNLTQLAGYWAETSVILRQQANQAQEQGEGEKVSAINSTAERAEEVAERIDGGAVLDEVRESLNDE